MVNWTLRESMREPEVEILLEQAKEKFPAGWDAPKPYLRITKQPS